MRWPSSSAGWVIALALALNLGALPASPALALSDLASFQPPGRMVLVEGRQVHIDCTGEGEPTVLLEEGRGGASLDWAWVQRDVTKASRVCSYDRPGYGWSEPAEAPMDASNTSQQLHELLQAAHEKGPYLLVGHSLGGAYMRMFAAEHREDVAGLVLVDATNPSHLKTNAEVGLPPIDGPKGTLLADVLTSSEVLWRAASWLGIVKTSFGNQWKELPADVVPEMSTFIAGRQHLRTFLEETSSLSDTLAQIASLGSLGRLPVTVICADKWIDADATIAIKRAEWNKRQQRNWLAISTDSHFLIVPGADHMSLLLVAEHADAVARAIVNMVVAIRGSSVSHPIAQ